MKMNETGTTRRRKERKGECVVVVEVRRAHQWEENYMKAERKPLQREGRSRSSLFGSDWTELLARYFWNLPLGHLGLLHHLEPQQVSAFSCPTYGIPHSRIKDHFLQSSEFDLKNMDLDK